MSTKRLAIFARRQEMNDWLDEACSSLGAALVQHDVEGLVHIVPSASRLEACAGLVRAYITLDAKETSLVTGKIVPGRMGLVICDLPIEEKQTLYLAVVASRSDWRGADGLRHDNPACHRLFAALRKAIARSIRAGVWTRSTSTDAGGPDREIYTSAGARAWVHAGGQLRQPGVANIEFLLDPPT